MGRSGPEPVDLMPTYPPVTFEGSAMVRRRPGIPTYWVNRTGTPASCNAAA